MKRKLAEETYIRKIWNYKWFMTIIVFCFTGLLLFVMSYALQNETYKAILSNIGIVLFITGVVTLTYDYLLKQDFIRLVGTCFGIRDGITRLGITDVSDKRDFENVLRLVKESNREVKILCLNSYVALFDWGKDNVIKFLSKGGTLKILMIDPASIPAKLRGDKHSNKDNYLYQKQLALEFLKEVLYEGNLKSYESNNSILVREYSQIPYCYLVIIDNQVAFYTPYLSQYSAKDLPAFTVMRDEGSLFNKLWEHFECYWDGACELKIERE